MLFPHGLPDQVGDVYILHDAGEVVGARTEGEDRNHHPGVRAGGEMVFANASIDAAVVEGYATGFVVGGDHHKSFAVHIGKVENNLEHFLEVGKLGFQVFFVIIVASPIYLRSFDHQHETILIPFAAEEC